MPASCRLCEGNCITSTVLTMDTAPKKPVRHAAYLPDIACNSESNTDFAPSQPQLRDQKSADAAQKSRQVQNKAAQRVCATVNSSKESAKQHHAACIPGTVELLGLWHTGPRPARPFCRNYHYPPALRRHIKCQVQHTQPALQRVVLGVGQFAVVH